MDGGAVDPINVMPAAENGLGLDGEGKKFETTFTMFTTFTRRGLRGCNGLERSGLRSPLGRERRVNVGERGERGPDWRGQTCTVVSGFSHRASIAV